jgi:phage pi2 protein 07
MYRIFYVYKNVTVLLPTTDVIANSQRYDEISSVLLPVYTTMAMAAKAMCKYYGRVSDVIRI